MVRAKIKDKSKKIERKKIKKKNQKIIYLF